MAGTAAEQARAVAGEARRQAGSTVHGLRQRLRDEGQGQTERLAGAVRQWADDLEGLARGAPGDSPARSLTARTADQGHRAADYLAAHRLDGMLGDLQDFGRRRPAAFLGGAVPAGLVVGRPGKAAASTDGGGPTAHRVMGAASDTGGHAAGRTRQAAHAVPEGAGQLGEAVKQAPGRRYAGPRAIPWPPG
ncbi:hypothetical protein AB0G71_10880 [Streptomyces sp. NPDC020403]|uniref:hypothetical protein n=1 Tax=unclassified Streptomyces TaxID=2593676 RepID=UPI0033D4BED9